MQVTLTIADLLGLLSAVIGLIAAVITGLWSFTIKRIGRLEDKIETIHTHINAESHAIYLKIETVRVELDKKISDLRRDVSIELAAIRDKGAD